MPRFSFDLSTLIKLVYAQYSSQERMDIIKALKLCNEGCWVSDNSISFFHPLKHGKYKWKERILITNDKVNIYIDLLRDNSIGGVEFEMK